MTEALAIISSGSTVALIGLVAWLTYKTIRAKDEQLSARDLLDAAHELQRATKGELDAETAAHAVTREQLSKEQGLRATTEAQRNDAYRAAREDYVERIKKSGIADAQRLVADLLAAPLPGVPSTVPEVRATPSDPDGLIDPGL